MNGVRDRVVQDPPEHIEKVGAFCCVSPIKLGCVTVLAGSANVSIIHDFFHDGENLIDMVIDIDFETVSPLLPRASLRRKDKQKCVDECADRDRSQNRIYTFAQML